MPEEAGDNTRLEEAKRKKNTVFVLISAQAPISAHLGNFRKSCAHGSTKILVFYTHFIHKFRINCITPRIVNTILD